MWAETLIQEWFLKIYVILILLNDIVPIPINPLQLVFQSCMHHK